MPEINVLTKEISELIAAGEVIERPSSVIKELIENSVDSGADTIIAEIKNGGITYMRITDNGNGISESDVKKAFLRHATSKISSKDDLNKILTLGFRGEALASITAVSKVDLLTKTLEEDYGTHYITEGSEEKVFEKSGCPNGTTIVIRDIFYNVPARLKFLKKDVTEGNAIANIINKIALSHPEISVKFIRDNKQELFTPGDGNLFSALYAVYGKTFADTLIPVDYKQNGIEVTGYISKPLMSRANRTMQNFFINGRYVKSVTCTVSLEEAYKNSIMTGKFPACILKLNIPPEIVDVNVHPAKTEVRFSDEKIIFDSVYFAVKNALLQNDMPTEMKISNKKTLDFSLSEKVKNETDQIKKDTESFSVQRKNDAEAVSVKVYSPTASDGTLKLSSPEPETLYDKEYDADTEDKNVNLSIIEENIFDIKEDTSDKKALSEFKYISECSFVKREVPEKCENTEYEIIPEIRIIGEAFKTYIIAEINNELIIIDKHAAHERILFEKLKNGNGESFCQSLLIPQKIILSEEECGAISENHEVVKQLGFTAECLSHSEVEISGIPSYLPESKASEILEEIAQNLIRCRNNPEPDAVDEMFHMMACKSAIKAHDKNDVKELKKLAETVYGSDEIRYCPHGRPVMITLTESELEKQFKRLV